MKTASARQTSVLGFVRDARAPTTLPLQQGFQRLAAVLSALIGTSLIGIFWWMGDHYSPDLWLWMALTTLFVWAGLCLLVWRGLPHHPHEEFGPANTITLCRGAGTAALAGWIPAAAVLPPEAFWLLACTAVLLLAMDGIDGYLARRSGLESAFGARFDMEVDALLTLVMSVFLWQSGETGYWILMLGLMRYAFVLASTVVTALNRPLFPSFRRKLICVIQLSALCIMLTPAVEPFLSTALGTIACLLLAASFLRDIHWLITRDS